MKKIKKLILTEQEFCYILNKRTGKIKLVEGPKKVSLGLGLFKEIYGGKQKKIILHEGRFAVILNPYDRKRRGLNYGDREVRVGPCMFSLYPGENIDKTKPAGTYNLNNGVRGVYILERNKGLVVKALRDFEDGDVFRKAGDEWIIRGPIHYVPHKYVLVRRMVGEISLAEHSGIYIKNTKTGEIRLEKGAKNIMLTPDEELYSKEYTNSEKDGIRFAKEYDWTQGRPLWVLEDEVTKIMTETNQKIIFGSDLFFVNIFRSRGSSDFILEETDESIAI